MSEMVKHLVGLAANCEDGWQYNPQSDKCYRFYDEEQSWPMSEIYCQFQAAHHVSIHSPQDLAFIQGKFNPFYHCWLSKLELEITKSPSIQEL